MSRYDLDRAALRTLLTGEPAYRADQLFDGLYRRLAEPEDCTELPKALRERLATSTELAPGLEVARESLADGGATVKWLFTLGDGATVETVLMHAPRRSTVCVSSQAGCAMACAFCATGDAGYRRQLSSGEILEQAVRAARRARADGRRLDHVVFMGMGEPLANAGAVLDAARRLVSDLGLAARHLTISTVGIVPGIRRLAAEPLQVNLAVSLHAANDELRSELVPANHRYPIADLVGACEEYRARTGRRISFEWALMAGVNDRTRDAVELAGLARSLGAHVNLIPLNPTDGGVARGLRGSRPERVRAFRDELLSRGVNVTVRRTRGRAIDAACGQLAGSASRSSTTTRDGARPVRPTAPDRRSAPT